MGAAWIIHSPHHHPGEDSSLCPPLEGHQWTVNPEFTSLLRKIVPGWRRKTINFYQKTEATHFSRQSQDSKVVKVNSVSREWFVNPEKQETGQKPYPWGSDGLKEYFRGWLLNHKQHSLTVRIRRKVRFILPEWDFSAFSHRDTSCRTYKEGTDHTSCRCKPGKTNKQKNPPSSSLDYNDQNGNVWRKYFWL